MKNRINTNEKNLCTTIAFDGESLEEKVRRVETSGAPVEAVSPMYYTERKEGVKPETNIRTDKWEVAREAMESIAHGIVDRRIRKIQNAENPDAGSKVNVQATQASQAIESGTQPAK